VNRPACVTRRIQHRGYRGLSLVWGIGEGVAYGAAEFLSVSEYRHVQRRAETILARPAVKRGRMVNRTYGEPSEQLRERHETSDFDMRTEDKLAGSRP